MSKDILAVVFKSVVLAKILDASPAWWGFANSSDKQRLEKHFFVVVFDYISIGHAT